MLLLSAFFAASGHLSIAGVIAAAAAGAILGDNLGYWIGRKGGRPLVRRFGRYVFVRERELATAERFFQRHGDKTVFFGRFISILRAWAAFLAGVNQMRWPVFLFYNAAGGICWSITFGVIGYFLGRTIGVDTIERYASELGYVVLGLVVVFVAFFLLRRTWRGRRAGAHDAWTRPASSPEGEAPAASQRPGGKEDQQPGA
jgi:membrane protein DedA with SNARE-associated domain